MCVLAFALSVGAVAAAEGVLGAFGVVTHRTGDALRAGDRVLLCENPNGRRCAKWHTTTTDAAGTYRFYDLNDGTSYLVEYYSNRTLDSVGSFTYQGTAVQRDLVATQ